MILITGFAPFGGDKDNPSRLAAQRAVTTLLGEGTPAAFLEVPVVFKRAGPAVLAEIARLNALVPHDPVSVVVCAGVAGNRRCLSLEDTAVNLQDGRIPDNDGDQPRGTPVIPCKPASGDRTGTTGSVPASVSTAAATVVPATPAAAAAAAATVPADAPDAPVWPPRAVAAEPNTNPRADRRGHDTLHTRLPIRPTLAAIQAAGIPVEVSHDAGLYVCNSLFYYTLHEIPEDVQVGFVHVPPERVVSIEKQAEALVIAAKTAAAEGER